MTRWAHAPGVLWRRSAGRIVVDPPDGHDALLLEGSAAAVWDLLADPQELDALSVELSRRFAVPAATVRDDIEGLLADLEAAGAVTCR